MIGDLIFSWGKKRIGCGSGLSLKRQDKEDYAFAHSKGD